MLVILFEKEWILHLTSGQRLPNIDCCCFWEFPSLAFFLFLDFVSKVPKNRNIELSIYRR